MPVYETRTTRVERTTLVLPGRVNWVEVEKAISAATQMVRARGIEEHDDTVWFVAHDDEILIELPEKELTDLGPREVAHIEADARRVFYRELLEWVDAGVGSVPGVDGVEELIRRMRRVDPNDPPWGTEDGR
jgi:hypothetical protein